MQLRKNIATSEDGFLFNPSTGDSWSANPMATEWLAWLKEGRSQEDIMDLVTGKYEVERSRVERDWDDFMKQLQEARLLQSSYEIKIK
jgi:hypothetical protein